MRSSRLVLLVTMLLGFSFVFPILGLAGDREDPRALPGMHERGIGHLHVKQNRTRKPIHEKIICDYTCANGSGDITTTETVADCFDTCAAYCGNPCDWAH